MSNPYILPPGNVQIAFSGGRTSAYMLHEIIEANGGLPEDRVQVIFANTGMEMPQTLDFVAEVGRRWGVVITWLEYSPASPGYIETGYQGASRAGEPFEAMIDKKKFLPNQRFRFCTTELKVRNAKRYLVDLGWKNWTAAVGFRADEAHRDKGQLKERWTRWTPLIAAGVTKRHVSAFWKAQPFDLRLPNINGKTPHGNCVGCFLKSEAFLARLAREMPVQHAWWERMEAKVEGLTTGDGGRWSKRFSRAELRNAVERQPLLLETEGALCQADGGECIA